MGEEAGNGAAAAVARAPPPLPLLPIERPLVIYSNHMWATEDCIQV